jgi:hypothetical protein
MNAPHDEAPGWARAGRAAKAPSEPDALMRFSISPTATGAWSWRVFSQDRTRAQGLAATRKLAAALVIHHIVAASTKRASAPLSARLSARAA